MSKSPDPSALELIFEHSPIPLWQMDYTELFAYFESLKQNRIQDLTIYFETNPLEITKCLSLNKIKQVNPAVLDLYEVNSKQELIENFDTFLSKKSIDSFKEQLNHFFLGQQNLAYDTEILTKTGKSKSIRLKINIHKKDEQIIGVISTEDITELKVHDKKEFIAAISQNPDSVTLNRVSDGAFVFVNQTFKEVSGFTDEDIQKKSASDLGMWVNEDDRILYLDELKKNGFIQDMATSFRTKKGEAIDVIISAKAISYNGEQHYIVTTKDATKINSLTYELKQSEEQFRKAFMNIPDSVHINKISDATFVDVNENFLKHTGFSREDLIGKTPHDLNIWVDGVTNRSFYRPLKKDGYISNLEITFRMKNGNLLHALISASVLELNGEPHIITVTKDITELKASQKELKRSEEKFQTIFSNSPDALAIMEMVNWTYVEVNEMFIKISGLPYEEIIGKSTYDLNIWTLESDRAFFTYKLQNREEIINHESLFTMKNGEQIHMLVSAKLIEIDGQKLYMLIAKNINDFVNIQKKLSEKDNRYKTIVSNSYEGIAIIDDAFQFDYINNQLELITGYSSEELIGSDFRNILTPESAVIVGQRYKDRQTGKDVPQKYTFQVKHKNGDIRTVEIHSSIVYSIEGTPQTIAQILDITDREKASKIIEQEHKRSKQYFDVAGIIMMVLDVHGNVKAINKKGCDVLETTEKNIVGKNWFSEFIPKNLSSQYCKRFLKSMEKEEFHNDYFENTIKTILGKEKTIAWRNSLLKDEDGKIIGTISSGEDISDKEEVSRILNMSGIVAIIWKNEKNSPIEFISENVEILLGYKPQDFYSQNINYHQLIHSDDIERLKKETKELTNKERSNLTHQPYRIIAKDGKVKWISDRTTVQYDSEGKITYFYGVLSDITEDILKGEKLRQSNEILSQMNDAVIITDFSGEITSWSGGAENIFGYTSLETAGKNIELIWDADNKATEKLSDILSYIELYGFFQNEISCIHKDGKNIPIELTAKILYDSFNNPISLILVNRDISNRKLAQKALEESEIRYRHIFESILDGVIIYNMNKEIVQVNKMTTQMYGYTYADFTQTATSRYIHPAQNIDFVGVINHLENNYDKMFEGESIDITKSGEKFFVNVKGRLIKYNNQPHLLIIVRDITHIKQAERDIVKAKEKAVQSEHLKSAFLANMSHEIRTPMNSIIGFSDLLGDDDISKDEKEHFIKIIRQNGNQLMNIINDIIDISKIEAGQIKLNYERIDLCETFKDIYNMFELSSKEKGLKLILKSSHPEDEYFIRTDELRLKQILINLISNALKFTHNGFIEFGCNIIDHEKSIHFYVKDTGIGISKDKQEEIFQRFMQAELKTTKLYGGTGLGLAISQGLVHTFRGQLWLESEEGMGSTFNFSIPLIHK
jgi:PAS domain S-box-containing protein